MSVVFYSLYTLAYFGLMIWAIRLFQRTHRAGTLFLVLVVFGLLYDNLILSIGSLVGAGDTLYRLNVLRFVFHQLFLPWVMVSAYEQVLLSGSLWAHHAAVRTGVWAATLVLMFIGIATRVNGLHLELAVVDGVTRYLAVGLSGPPIVSIVSVAFTGVMGLLLWRRIGWPWTLVTSVLVFVGESVPIDLVRRLAGSGVEVLFMLALLVIEARCAAGSLALQRAKPAQVGAADTRAPTGD